MLLCRASAYGEPLPHHTIDQWLALSDEDRVRLIIEHRDARRFDHEGGYPSDYHIENETVYWASIDDGKPDLTIATVSEFIADEEYLDDLVQEWVIACGVHEDDAPFDPLYDTLLERAQRIS
jgi:hypothetical protein